ncbi:MAG: trigger factor [Lachnospiraceae bacterium]|nr:trigger factor [Lachnospiraceae bacterium]MBR3581073.1 trigger factor [Lachnospiraceae bacterium]MBR4541858.1 trigger factor [Lachnospiraceae bacterium]
MKKIAVIFLMAVMVLSLAACGKKDEKVEEEKPFFQREDGAHIITGYKSGDVKLGQYTGLTYKPESVDVSDEEINAEFDSFVSSWKSLTEVTDRTVVQDGDVVDIDYAGYRDGVAFEGGTGSKKDLRIGSGAFIPGFEDALIGHEKGTTFDINVTFPEDYHNKDLAGVDAVFTITLKGLYYYKYPEVTDAFVAEKTDNKYATVDAYKENIKLQIKSKKEEAAELAKQDEVAKKAIENATFNVDLTEEMQRTLANLKNYNDTMYMNAFGVDGAGYYYIAYGMPSDQYEEYLRNMTEFSVKYEYVRSAIVEAERFEVTDEEIKELAENLMKQSNLTDINALYDAIKKQNGVEGTDFLREQVKLNKASDLMFSTAIPE